MRIATAMLMLAALTLAPLPLFAAEGISAATSTTNSVVTIPIELSGARVMVPARVNGSGLLRFLLDTGYTIHTIHPAHIEPLGLQRSGRVTIVGIAGEEEAGTYSGVQFDLGGWSYSPRRVASLPSERGRARLRRDGILGAGLFRRFVVEVDVPGRRLRLHEPRTFEYKGAGEIIPLEIARQIPVIEAGLLLRNETVVRGRFEIDTGCDDVLCLGADFVRSNHLHAVPGGAADVKQGVGGDARIQSGTVPQLRLGTWVVEKPVTSFFLDGSPVDAGYAGHIGMAAFHRCRVIFDYAGKRLIVEPVP